MADNVTITPGSGASVAADDVGGILYQRVKLDIGGDGVTVPVPGDNANGVDVDVTRVSGSVTVVQPTATNLKVDASGVAVPVTDNAGSLTIDAPVATPVFVRLSSGSAAVDTLPVSGSITAAQGTPASAAAPWPVKICDGTTVAPVDAATGGLKVYIAGGSAGGTSLADKAAFVEGTTVLTPIGGEFIAAPTDPSDGHIAVARVTVKRALHINLRDNSGVELGTAGNPARVDPTGSTVQPVSGTVTAKLKDDGGTAYSASNPLYVSRGGRAQTRVTKSVAITASATGTVVWTPASGKKFYITKIIINLTVAGTFALFDGTNAAGNLVTDGTLPIASHPWSFEEPWASATADNILKYTTGTGITGVITVHGFEV